MNTANRIYARLEQHRPALRTELVFHNHYTLLVAVVLSAQATDAGVNRATATLFTLADTPHKMLALGEKRLASHIRSLGLWRNKSRNVIALSQHLIDRYHGTVPDTLADLTSLPGVGRKTANVVLNQAFGHNTIAVDTHVFRVANRTGLGPGNTPLEVENALMASTPVHSLPTAHHALILHGRYVCKARKPLCHTCVIEDLCQWPDKTS